MKPEIRQELSEIFNAQFEIIENDSQKLFKFGTGDYAKVEEYSNKISFAKNNIVYSWDQKPIMCVFAFTGKRALKIEKILDKTNLKVIGVRVYKNCVVPMHVDPNYHSIGRDNPIHFIVVSANSECMIYFSNRKDGSKQLAIPGLSEFVMHPTEIEHGARAGGQHMDMIQIMVEQIK